jgi:hypothetical protein
MKLPKHGNGGLAEVLTATVGGSRVILGAAANGSIETGLSMGGWRLDRPL